MEIYSTISHWEESERGPATPLEYLLGSDEVEVSVEARVTHLSSPLSRCSIYHWLQFKCLFEIFSSLQGWLQ